MMQMLRKGMSRNLFIGISAVFFLLVVLMSLSFHYMIARNSAFLQSLVLKTGEEYVASRALLIIERAGDGRYRNPEHLAAELRRYALSDASILGIMIFGRTADENYFRLLSKNSLNAAFTIEPEVGSVVTLESSNEYLQKGLFNLAVDPAIHANGPFVWRNVYHPFRFERRNLVICFMVSSAGGLAVLDEYESSIEKLKKIVVLVHSAAALAVVVMLALFLHNYRLLLNLLANSLKRASSGDLSVQISTAGGDELEELAASFNSLVEELRVMKEKEKTVSARDSLDDAFAIGVDKLKMGMLDDAIHIFSALTILRPESFGSFFNAGVAYAKMRRYDASIEMFERALSINPAHETAKSYLEKVRVLRDRYGGEHCDDQG
jgi:tetratricopeptide (TPR) repeat protein